MSHANVTTWTCDTCGDRVEVPAGQLPRDWREHTSRRLDASNQDPAKPAEDKRWEVCPSCDANVERALAPKNDRVGTLQRAAGL
jgi:hypothetical protein